MPTTDMKSLRDIFGKVRKGGTSSFWRGRRPDTHWMLLLGLFAIMVITAVGLSGFVFWWGTTAALEGGDVKQESRSFNKRQFESVLEYFKSRDARFKAVPDMSVPVDPS